MATDFNPLTDNGGGPVPPIDPADLRTVWAMMKIIPDYYHGKIVFSLSDDFYRALSPGANVGAVWYRWSVLELLHRTTSKPGRPTLPGMKDGKPTDALFKAFAIVPMTALGLGESRRGFPFDWDELIRLVEIESEV